MTDERRSDYDRTSKAPTATEVEPPTVDGAVQVSVGDGDKEIQSPTIRLWGERNSINPDDIEAGWYLTWTQAVRRVQEAFFWDEAWSREWIAIQLDCGGLLVWWEHWHDPNPALPMRDVRSDSPPRDREYWRTAEFDPSNPDFIREPAYDYLIAGERVVARPEHECGYRKPMFHRTNLAEAITETKKLFKPAPTSAIRAAIEDVYDMAAARGGKPPNINQIGAPVREALFPLGWTAADRRIEVIAREPQFETRRLPRGRPR